MSYGVRVKQYREARGLTQDELARRTGIPSTSISRIENGGRKVTLEEAVKICEALRIDLTTLAGTTAHDSEAASMRQATTKFKQRLDLIRSELDACETELAAVS